LARQKKVGVADSANGPMPGLSPFFFRLVKCPGPVVQPRARGPLFGIPPAQPGKVQGGSGPGWSRKACAAEARRRRSSGGSPPCAPACPRGRSRSSGSRAFEPGLSPGSGTDRPPLGHPQSFALGKFALARKFPLPNGSPSTGVAHGVSHDVSAREGFRQ